MYYTVSQIAEMLDTCKETVRRWIRSGKLKGERSSNKDGYLVLETDFIAFQDQKKNHKCKHLEHCNRNEQKTARKRYFIDRYDPYTATEYEIVKKTGIDIRTVRAVLSSLETWYIAPWPENLRIEVFGYMDAHPMTDDQLKGLDYAIETLSDREKHCIFGYFKYGMSMKTIGIQQQVTVERIRQIICKALRKLRHPSRMNYILLGYEGAEARKMLTEKEISRVLEEERRNAFEAVKQKKDALDTKIEELDWSVRAYNCLKRSGIDTMKDLIKFVTEDGGSEEDMLNKLYSIRNLGKHTAKEILDKMWLFEEEVKANGQKEV